MSPPRRLLCSLPILTLALAAVAAPVRDADGAMEPQTSDTLIDVKDANHPKLSLQLDDDSVVADPQTWSASLDELSLSDEGGHNRPLAGFTPLTLRAPEKPPIIAAPLPPAIISGAIGLAGVYAYKRRHQLR